MSGSKSGLDLKPKVEDVQDILIKAKGTVNNENVEYIKQINENQ